MYTFKVESCETGDIYKVRIDQKNFRYLSFTKSIIKYIIPFTTLPYVYSVSELKANISTFSTIPVNDLILLIGPPFKSLDSNVSNQYNQFNMQINSFYRFPRSLSRVRYCPIAKYFCTIGRE